MRRRTAMQPPAYVRKQQRHAVRAAVPSSTALGSRQVNSVAPECWAQRERVISFGANEATPELHASAALLHGTACEACALPVRLCTC